MAFGDVDLGNEGPPLSYSVNIPTRHSLRLWSAMLCLLTLLQSAPSPAATLYASTDFSVSLDTTLRYTAAIRIDHQDPTLEQAPNNDDGDRNFAPGLVANRLDILSELDIDAGDVGVHASGAAWYDTVYHARTDNHSEATYNVLSVPSTEFAHAVRTIHGEDIELRDAFGYANLNV